MAKAEKKKAYPKFLTPVGTFKYPALHEPSYGTEEYPQPQGVYKLSLILRQDDPATKALIEKLQPLYREAEAEGQQAFDALPIAQRKKVGGVSLDPFFEIVYDQDTEQPTGEIEFRFKLNATGAYKKGPKAGETWSAKPTVFDSFGRRIHPVPSIWSGSTGRVSFTPIPYFVAATGKVGLSRRLNGVQLVTLVTKGEQTAESLGFGAIEGGYSFDNEDNATDQTPGEEATGEKLAF